MSGFPEGEAQQFPEGAPQVAPQKPDQVLAIISLVTGILSIVTLCCCIYVVPIPAITGIITGILGLKKVKEGTGGGKGMAMAGLICGSIALVLGILGLVAFLVLGVGGSIFEELQRR